MSRVTNEISMEKKIGPTKYIQGKSSDPQNTHEKKIRTYAIHKRKNLGPTIYRQGEILDPRNTHKKRNLDLQRHEPTMAR